MLDAVQDTFVVTVVDSLKGEFAAGYEVELTFFMDTVGIGEQHIVAIKPGPPHPSTGLQMTHFTSRNSLFNLDQWDEIETIVANAPDPIYRETTDAEPEERIVFVDAFLHEHIGVVGDIIYTATDVIQGEILEQRVEWLDLTFPREVIGQLLVEEGLIGAEDVALARGLELVTVSRIQISEIFYGNHQVGDIIEIMQLGGEYGSQLWIVNGAPALRVNSESILFLVSGDLIEQPYSMLVQVWD